MAVRSIVSVDLDVGKLGQFQRLYAQYDKALKSAPAAWKMVQQNIDGSRASFDKLVDQMAAANVQTRLREKAQERADQLTRTSADRWRDIARFSRETAGNIAGATLSLLKWTSITGVVSGLLGAGSLFGIERLALSAGAGLRTATGRGTTIGGQTAFSGGLQAILENPDSFLGAIAAAKYDVTQAPGLISAGLTPGQRAGDTTDAALAVLRGLRRESQQWNPAMYANMLQANRQTGFATPELLGTLRGMSDDRFQKLLEQVQRRRSGFELPRGVAEKWQDFTTQMANAGHQIELSLIRGLVPLAPGLTKLSESVSRTIDVFLSSPTLKKWMVELGDGLEKFAGYVGTEEFQGKVRQFARDIFAIADAVGGAIRKIASWFGKDERPKWGYDSMGAPALPPMWPVDDMGLPTQPHWQHKIWRGDMSGLHNPGNMRVPGGSQFQQFEDDRAGVRAIAKQLLIYKNRDRLDTISDLIAKYAPPSENDTAAYIKDVSKRTGFAPGAHLNLTDRDTMSRLIAAIVAHEQRAGSFDKYKSPRGVVEVFDNTGGNATVSVNGLKQ